MTTEKNAFIFLCDQSTEIECLKKLLVGSTQKSALWAMSIKPGDAIYLFNFNTGVVRGPYLAASSANCFDNTAWGGIFPVQVQITKTSDTRKANSSMLGAPTILRRKRPSGDIGPEADGLAAWIRKCGIVAPD